MTEEGRVNRCICGVRMPEPPPYASHMATWACGYCGRQWASATLGGSWEEVRGPSHPEPQPDGGRVSPWVVRVQERVAAADRKWGEQRGFPPASWLAVLAEEVGEVARIVTDWLSVETGRSDMPGSQEGLERLRDEIADVAAVCVRWLVALEGR